MIKIIIFDLRSICFHINWIGINKEMSEKFGITTLIRTCGNKKAEQYYNDFLEGKGDIKKVFTELNPNCNLDKSVRFYKELYKKNKKIEIFELIKKIKGKYKLVCLTNTNKVHFDVHNEQNHLKDFDKVFASFQLGMRKSNPKAFSVILNNLKVRPKEVIFIEDNEKNIENARLSGINAIRFEDNKHLINDLNKLGVKR